MRLFFLRTTKPPFSLLDGESRTAPHLLVDTLRADWIAACVSGWVFRCRYLEGRDTKNLANPQRARPGRVCVRARARRLPAHTCEHEGVPLDTILTSLAWVMHVRARPLVGAGYNEPQHVGMWTGRHRLVDRAGIDERACWLACWPGAGPEWAAGRLAPTSRHRRAGSSTLYR